MRVVYDIIKAQDFLKEKYGEEAYQELVDRCNSQIQQLSNDVGVPVLDILSAISKDDKLSPEVRIAAVAAMGE